MRLELKQLALGKVGYWVGDVCQGRVGYRYEVVGVRERVGVGRGGERGGWGLVLSLFGVG